MSAVFPAVPIRMWELYQIIYLLAIIFISVILITQKFRKILRFAQDDTDGTQDDTVGAQDDANDDGISGKA